MMMMNHYFLAPKLFPLFLSSLWIAQNPCKNLQVETQWVGHSVAQTLLYEIELFSNILTLRGHFAADCKGPLMKCISNFLNS